ncbi:hypothetical protein RUM43_012669 [Polyplax serrata]|uniref:Uncharacterized protein n=1 Tax=Polyplax serrata TaxID=468196 RepID=A0AAN8S772_POLSC
MTQCAWSHGQKRNAAKVCITDTLMFKDRYRRKHESVKDDRHKAGNAKDTSALHWVQARQEDTRKEESRRIGVVCLQEKKQRTPKPTLTNCKSTGTKTKVFHPLRGRKNPKVKGLFVGSLTSLPNFHRMRQAKDLQLPQQKPPNRHLRDQVPGGSIPGGGSCQVVGLGRPNSTEREQKYDSLSRTRVVRAYLHRVYATDPKFTFTVKTPFLSSNKATKGSGDLKIRFRRHLYIIVLSTHGAPSDGALWDSFSSSMAHPHFLLLFCSLASLAPAEAPPPPPPTLPQSYRSPSSGTRTYIALLYYLNYWEGDRFGRILAVGTTSDLETVSDLSFGDHLPVK